MFPVAARFLLPVSVSVLVVIYKYFRSGRESELADGGAVPPNPGNTNRTDDQSDRPPSAWSSAPSDLDPEILDWFRNLDPAVLDRIRRRDPALLDEIQKFDPGVEIQNFDPSIVDDIRKLNLKKKEGEEEEKKEGGKSCDERETEKERESESGGGGENENGVEESTRRNQYPLRPEARECSHNCKHGSGCKFNHPRRRKNKQKVPKNEAKQREELEEKQDQTKSKKVPKNEAKQREELEEKQDQTKSKKVPKNEAKQREELEEKQDQTKSKVSKNEAKQREELEEKQNQTKSKVSKNEAKQREELEEKQGQAKSKKVPKNKAKQREELEEKQDQTKSKYYISPGLRRGGPSVAPALKLNFLGLPMRPGEKDCQYYIRNASCKFGTNCRFNHPDPTAAGESRPQSAYSNGWPASVQGLPMMIPKSQGSHSETTEWNGYQAPAYLPHRSMPAPPPYVMNNSVAETNFFYGQYAQQKQVEELPERPGLPVCIYFAQTGDCNYKSNCKYHHPKHQTAATPSCALSDKGLPSRPGQNICTQYSRSGVCSYGVTCRFDHPSLSDSFL